MLMENTIKLVFHMGHTNNPETSVQTRGIG
ncbi:hypothetical protein A2U01_0031256, partial [Trifolium medium]|nr:hypothetical protein [Trifolium medium]